MGSDIAARTYVRASGCRRYATSRISWREPQGPSTPFGSRLSLGMTDIEWGSKVLCHSFRAIYSREVDLYRFDLIGLGVHGDCAGVYRDSRLSMFHEVGFCRRARVFGEL